MSTGMAKVSARFQQHPFRVWEAEPRVMPPLWPLISFTVYSGLHNLSALGLTFTPEVDEHVYRDGKSLSSFSAASF
jgi:hypothetical protein